MLHRTLQDLCSSWHLVIDQINIVLTTISAVANFQAILNVSCLETIFHISQFHPKQNLINSSSLNIDVFLLTVSCSSRLCTTMVMPGTKELIFFPCSGVCVCDAGGETQFTPAGQSMTVVLATAGFPGLL